MRIEEPVHGADLWGFYGTLAKLAGEVAAPCMGLIPLTLHQTWKTREIPAEWRHCVESFARHNPDFTYRLWSDDDARALVAGQFPGLLDTFDRYPYPILRADLFRYLVLFRHGGVYADLDVLFLAPLRPLLSAGGVVLGLEPPAHARLHGVSQVVGNAVIASEPGHPLWQHVLETLQAAGPSCLTHRDVLELTGPLRLQRILDQDPGHWGRLGVRVHKSQLFNPLSGDELSALRTGTHLDDGLLDRLRDTGSVALHLFHNSWVRALAGPLVNPEPHGMEGFEFFAGVDSGAFDIANVGRNIPIAAAACRDMHGVVAFNTDGFAKTRLRAPWHWRRLDNPEPGEGLYVSIIAWRGAWMVRFARAWLATRQLVDGIRFRRH
jgi:hypothetical protein